MFKIPLKTSDIWKTCAVSLNIMKDGQELKSTVGTAASIFDLMFTLRHVFRQGRPQANLINLGSCRCSFHHWITQFIVSEVNLSNNCLPLLVFLPCAPFLSHNVPSSLCVQGRYSPITITDFKWC